MIVACIVGDGEAETGPLAASWHSNKFLNPARDGAVLPILHLNGFKIANPTVLARISREELTDLLHGYGYEPHFAEGDEPAAVHELLATALDRVLAEIRRIQSAARSASEAEPPDRPRRVEAARAQAAAGQPEAAGSANMGTVQMRALSHTRALAYMCCLAGARIWSRAAVSMKPNHRAGQIAAVVARTGNPSNIGSKPCNARKRYKRHVCS